MPLGWEPEDYLYLPLQDALQLGEGSGAFQETDAGHFEISLMHDWTMYEDGTKSFTFRVDPALLDDADNIIPDDESPLMDEQSSDKHGKTLGSGPVGYNVIISIDNLFIDTIVSSYDDLVATLAPYHPQPNQWQPGWQVAEMIVVSHRGASPFQIEYHGNNKAILHNFFELAESGVGVKGVTLTTSEGPYGMPIMDVTPNDETTVIEVATAIAKSLHMRLDDFVATYIPNT